MKVLLRTQSCMLPDRAAKEQQEQRKRASWRAITIRVNRSSTLSRRCPQWRAKKSRLPRVRSLSRWPQLWDSLNNHRIRRTMCQIFSLNQCRTSRITLTAAVLRKIKMATVAQMNNRSHLPRALKIHKTISLRLLVRSTRLKRPAPMVSNKTQTDKVNIRLKQRGWA